MDLAGGTLDIWPLGLMHAGARTVNCAIDVAARVALSRRESGFRLIQGDELLEAASAAELAALPGGALLGVIARELELPPVDIEVSSGSPRGGGLGASSAIAIAAIAAGEALLEVPASSPEQRAALASDLEVLLMSLPTGKQDQLAALHGGVLEIRYLPGGERVRSLDVDLEALGDSLVVVYSGQTHFSAGNNWHVVRRRLDGDGEAIAAFDGITRAAAAMPAALEAGELEAVGALMSEEWSHRRRLAPQVSTPVVETLLDGAHEAGAWGGKVCGAGGGGCLAFLCPPASRAQVASRLESLGGKVLEARPAAGPVEVRVESA